MSRFTGTPALTRFALRRDRILLPIWILLIVMMAGFSASASADLFPTLASRVEASLALNTSQAFVSLLGRVYDPTSLGALSLIKLTTFGTAFIAVFAIMLVVRHTRREEENGRLELLGATVVGRQAALTAALLVALLTMGAIGVLTPLVLIAAGLPAEGAWAFGAAWAATGITFAAIAAVAAQLTVSARTANGIAFTVLALAYTLRAVGDTAGDLSGPGFASWLSPIGWAQQVRPFAGDRWWVLGLLMLLTALTLMAAYALAARRDLGAGLLADRPGPAEAEPRLASPLALAWRLQRAPLAAWAAGYVLLGFVYGNMASSVNSFLTSAQFEEYLRKLGGPGSLTDAFFSAEYGFLAIVTAAYGVSVALRLRTEEESGHAELLLATSISRTRWLASHVVVALVGTTILSLLAGLTSAVANAVQIGSTDGFAEVVAGVLVYLPAVWVLVGLVVTLFGFVPRLVPLAWAALVGFVLLGEFATLLRLPTWAADLSPFTHVPKLPGAAMAWTPVVLLLLVAVALGLAGTVGFRDRDLDTT